MDAKRGDDGGSEYGGKTRTKAGGFRARSHGVSLTWLLLSVAVVAALAVGACALWLPDRAPALLGEAVEVRSAPASVQEYTGGQQVTVVPTMSADRDLLGNATGTVTADWSGEGLASGRAAYRVDGRSVVALSSATPPYRDLTVGARGDDVLALNNELNRLGYASAPDSDVFASATAAGWRQLMVDNGNTSDGLFRLSDVLWIPSPSVAVNGWKATQGSNVSAGAPVGTIGGTIVKLTVKNGQPADQDRTVSVFGQTGTLPAGSVEITDGEFLAKVAATHDFRTLDAQALPAGFDATLSLTQPIQVLRVPAGAVFDIDGQSGCIAPSIGSGDKSGTGEPVKVDIVGGQLGVSLVRPRNGDVSSFARVAIGGGLNGLSCK